MSETGKPPSQNGLAAARLAATAAAISGDSGRLYHLVSGLLGEGVPFDTILFDLLGPTQSDIGARWQSGDYLISEEHAATGAVETVVALLAGSFDQPEDGDHIVVAAAEGDDHSLPARMVAAHLIYMGNRTTFLGANVLATDLREYLASEPPQALVLTCAMANHLIGARAAIRAAHAAGVPVVAGGRAFGSTADRASLLGADAWAPTLRGVPGILESWSPTPDSAEAAARDPSPDLVALIGRRASITAAAQRALESVLGGPGDARLTAEVSLLLGAIEAAMLIGDGEVATDMLRWQQTTLAAHGYSQGSLVADSLRAALGEIAPVAQEILIGAMDKAGSSDDWPSKPSA